MIQSFGWSSIQFLFHGFVWTIGLSAITFVFGGLFGLVFALARALGPRWLKLIVMGYIQLVQATPLLILVFLAFYGLSFLGLHFPPLIAHDLCYGLPRRHLARLHRGDPPDAMGGRRRPGAQPNTAAALRHPAAGL
jgi:His/Glu/Gln/Arg/opine family amino acid ABC transporter permease subunit